MDKHNDNIFCEYTIKSWEDGRKLFKLLTNWIFRGQSDSSWSLQTSLERSTTINQLHSKEIPEIEKRIIEKFKRRAFNYIDCLPEKEIL